MRSLGAGTPSASDAGRPTWRLPLALRLMAAAALCVLASLALSTSAHAHTELVSSTPAAGGVAPMQLDRVVLTFDTDLVDAGSAVAVQDAEGREVRVQDVGSHGSTVEARITLETPGRHTLSYRVVGQDGHPIVGELSFTVDASAPDRPAPVSAPDRPAPASAPAQLGAATQDTGAAADGPSDGPTGGLVTGWALPLIATGALVLALQHRSRRRRRSATS